MTPEKKTEITQIAKEFAAPFKDTIGEINGSGFLIVDPLSGYLNYRGFKNKLKELPANEKHPQILIMIFEDGTQFIPAGADLKCLSPEMENWFWFDAD